MTVVRAMVVRNAGADDASVGGAGAAPPRLLASSPPRLDSPSHVVELFGVPRLITGERVLAASGATLAALAGDLLRRYPVLAGRVLDAESGWPLAGYCFVVDEQFTRDREHPLRPETSVLLVASAAGG
jgi:hypothetical protein